jgi:hypothetical protein
MKTVKELTREQLIELKQNYLTQKMDEKGESPSYGELAEADQTVTDDEIYAEYDGTMFSDDDFLCSCEPLQSKSIETYIMEVRKGEYLRINAMEDGDGTWFDFTKNVWDAYMHDLDILKEIASDEFHDFEDGYPKFHRVRYTFEKIDTVSAMTERIKARHS